MNEELFGEIKLRLIVLCHDKKAGCILINSMHEYSHPFILCIRALRYPQMMSQCIDKGTGKMSMSRMYHHSCFFIQYKEIIIFIYNVQRNILWKNLQATTLVWHHEFHDISWPHYIIGLDDLIIHPDIFSLDSQLYTMTRCVFHMCSKVLVHTHRDLTGRNIKAVMLKHFLLLILTSYFIRKFVFRFIPKRKKIQPPQFLLRC